MSRCIWIACLIMPTIAPYFGTSASSAGERPQAEAVETESEFAAAFIASAGKGYAARPCGFDSRLK